MFKIAFIINGSKKLTSEVEEVIAECQNHPQIELKRFVTKQQKDATRFALDCCEKEYEYVVAVGGDGTINEVLNGIMQFDGECPILGVLPIGTGNDFVKSAGLKLNKTTFLHSILTNSTNEIDTVKLETVNSVHYFLNIADVGFGGKVVELLEQQRKYFGGKASYALAIVRTFLKYKRPIVSIQTNDFKYEGEILMIAICNGSTFGNGLIINPSANMNDGILNITLLKKVTLVDYVKNLKNLKKGQEIKHNEAIYLQTKSVEIKILKGEAVSELDGESLKDGNVIACIQRKIKVLNY